MPSARLKLVKSATPSTALPSSFCSDNARTCTIDIHKTHERISLENVSFESAHCREAGSCSLAAVQQPPQRHHFSKNSDWLCYYRRWLKNSKAIWLQRLHGQHSILHFFASEPRRHSIRPRAFALKGTKKKQQKNATLEAYGARAGSFKTSRCCVHKEFTQTQLK